MTLENMLRQQLDESADGFHITSGPWSVTLVSEQGDRLSCALKQLTLERQEPTAEQLQPWAERVARQATGLLEPLRLIEVDPKLGKALLRSSAPALKEGMASYYELTLERTTRSVAELKRYAADRVGGETRQSVPFVLTHDAIVKLALDIVGTN